MTTTLNDLVLERERLHEEIAAKKYSPHERLAELEEEIERHREEAERAEAAKNERLAALMTEYVPLRDRADALTSDLAAVMEQASKLRARLVELGARVERVEVRASRQDPETLRSSPLAEARARLRRAMTLPY